MDLFVDLFVDPDNLLFVFVRGNFIMSVNVVEIEKYNPVIFILLYVQS